MSVKTKFVNRSSLAIHTPVEDKEATLSDELQLEIDKTYDLPIDFIKSDSNQPRKKFDEDAMGKLVESIQEKGVLQNIGVRKDGDAYLIIYGERRWRAAKILGLKTVPVKFKGELSEAEVREISLIENIHRENLTPIEEARAYKGLMDLHGYTQEQLAHKLSRDQSTISRILNLLTLPENIINKINEDTDTHYTKRMLGELTKVKDPEKQQEIFQSISDGGIQKGDDIKRVRNKPASQNRTPIDILLRDITNVHTRLEKINLPIYGHNEKESVSASIKRLYNLAEFQTIGKSKGSAIEKYRASIASVTDQLNNAVFDDIPAADRQQLADELESFMTTIASVRQLLLNPANLSE